MRNNSKSGNCRNSRRAGEKGFSLLELLIAIVLFTVISGSIYGVVQVALRSRNLVSQKSQLHKNVRLSLNLVGRDTLNAGYGFPSETTSVKLPDNRITTLLGLPNDADSTDDEIAPIIVGNNRNANTFAVPNTNTDQVTFFYKDSNFNLVGSTTPTDRRVSRSLNLPTGITSSGGNRFVYSGAGALIRVNDLLLVSNGGDAALGVVTAVEGGNTVRFNAGDSLLFNQANGPMSLLTVASTAHLMRLVTYFVTTDGILTRREFANVAPTQVFVDEPLVYGVENFQAQYVLSDGTVSDSPTNLENIRQIKFTISVKSTEVDQRGQPYQITMNSTFSTRNLGYE